jgi:hypothetical protein
MAVGGLLYQPVARPSWATTVWWVHGIRTSPHARALGLLLSVAGLVLLTWAWFSVRRRTTGDAGVSVARGYAALWSVPLFAAPPLFSGDGWSYVATGYLTGHGLSPYTWTPQVLPWPLLSGVDVRWRGSPSPYGPLALGWGAAASAISSNPWLLLVAYRLLAVVGLGLVAWAVPRLARRTGQDPGAASWLAVASPFVLSHGIGGLHNDLVMAGLVATGVAVTSRDRWFAGAVLAGAAAAVKIPGGLAVIPVALLSLPEGRARAGHLVTRLGRTVLVGGVASGVVVLAGMLAGVGVGWIHALGVPGTVSSTLSLPTAFGDLVHRILADAGVSRHAMSGNLDPVTALHAAGLVAIALTAALLLVRPARDERAIVLGFSMLMLVLALLGPATHYWYLLWCLPVLAAVRLSAGAAAALVSAVAVLGVSAVADPSLHLLWLTNWSEVALLLVPLAAWFRAAAREEDSRVEIGN